MPLLISSRNFRCFLAEIGDYSNLRDIVEYFLVFPYNILYNILHRLTIFIQRERMIKRYFDRVLHILSQEIKRHYGHRLVSIIIFGSVARKTYRADSDIDILLIVDRLPEGRMKRIAEFMKIEKKLEDFLTDLRKKEIFIELSPVIKSPEEAEAGSPLFLDMIEDSKILYDKNHFFAGIIKSLEARLKVLGAKRIWKGNAWYWDLKPDYKPGEVIEI
jgi:predicted nucleotidyltransferase